MVNLTSTKQKTATLIPGIMLSGQIGASVLQLARVETELGCEVILAVFPWKSTHRFATHTQESIYHGLNGVLAH